MPLLSTKFYLKSVNMDSLEEEWIQLPGSEEDVRACKKKAEIMGKKIQSLAC